MEVEMGSQEFKNALKLYPIPKHRLAWKIGITPSTLSNLVHEHVCVRPREERLLKIARLIQFPEEKVFIEENTINP